ncbi:hypothetical protein BXZ70DRAFT_898340 [Cristinia sonorae]|uniref:F-box domain-containing protein n=1 Tax=Cristinia sonorae TaxID=1940300 RepID=A0A8K0UIE5_9AGAR|nr:hypothetical protein BXZ70DRAFT_898340 [Cristinia sonorae]
MNQRSFSQLDDDVLIHIFGFLNLSSLLRIRQTSKRCLAISQLLVVWKNIFREDVLRPRYPYPPEALETNDAGYLEFLTRRSCQLASFWLSPTPSSPRLCHRFDTRTSGTGISEIRFIPGTRAQRVVLVSKGIWSVVSCWDLGVEPSVSSTPSINPRKIAEWRPSRVILTGFAVNSRSEADGLFAVGLNRGGDHSIEILTLRAHQVHIDGAGLPYELTCIQTVETNCIPMALHGSTLIISDGARETHIVDWKTANTAVLQRPASSDEYELEHNRCLQVVLTEYHVFVVRAHVVELYPIPQLFPPPVESNSIVRPVMQFSLGWIDDASITPQLPASIPHREAGANLLPPISIVLRSEVNDPWSSDSSNISMYALKPSKASDLAILRYFAPHIWDGDQAKRPPYVQNPTLVASIPNASRDGVRSLRCPVIRSGRFGTSIWIQPPRRFGRDIGLTTFDVHSSRIYEDIHTLRSDDNEAVDSDMLVGAVFPGQMSSLMKRHGVYSSLDDKFKLSNICSAYTGSSGEAVSTSSGYWMSMDYAEEWGRIVLGYSDGTVMFVEL